MPAPAKSSVRRAPRSSFGVGWSIPFAGRSTSPPPLPSPSSNVALARRDAVSVAAAADPTAAEVFWTDGDGSYRRFDAEDYRLVPTSLSGLIEINCDGPVDRPFVGGQLVSDPRLRAVYGPRVISSTLAVAWVAAGRRAAHVSDGQSRQNLHFAAGIALCQAAGCKISSLDGSPLHANRKLVIAADENTHERVLTLVKPHLVSTHSAG